jgi:predicted nucleotidyltransferase
VAPSGAVQRELSALVEAGILSRHRVANASIHSANQKNLIFTELQSIVRKSSTRFEPIGRALQPLSSRIRLAFVYGSFARGEEKSGSDVDLMIVGDITLKEVVKALRPVQENLNHEINPTVFRLKDFQQKLREGNHFLSAVIAGPKVVLHGDTDELGRFRAE